MEGKGQHGGGREEVEESREVKKRWGMKKQGKEKVKKVEVSIYAGWTST